MEMLNQRKCKPCEGGIPTLTEKQITDYMNRIDTGWNLSQQQHLRREFQFVNFRHTMSFVNKLAVLAEEEGHHPVMHVYYGKVEIELWTHAINGLSENDFILAAKIDKL